MTSIPESPDVRTIHQRVVSYFGNNFLARHLRPIIEASRQGQDTTQVVTDAIADLQESISSGTLNGIFSLNDVKPIIKITLELASENFASRLELFSKKVLTKRIVAPLLTPESDQALDAAIIKARAELLKASEDKSFSPNWQQEGWDNRFVDYIIGEAAAKGEELLEKKNHGSKASETKQDKTYPGKVKVSPRPAATDQAQL